MKQCKILRGISGSGKSTYARNLMLEDFSFVEVNRDAVRRLILTVPEDVNLWSVYKLNNKFESEVTRVVNDTIVKFSKLESNIIDSDTNLNQKYLEQKIEFYKSLGYEVKVITLDEDVYECIDRDAKRVDSVGCKVIFKQYLQLKEAKRNKSLVKPDSNKPNVVVSDLDGTIALMRDRSAFEFDKVYQDDVREEIVMMINSVSHQKDADLIFCSGRDDSCFNETRKWLAEKAGFFDFGLVMRETGDKRKDSIVKKEFLDKIRSQYNIIAWFDDRPAVVDMLYDEGVNVVCVADQRLRF
jgi:predicted kinase